MLAGLILLSGFLLGISAWHWVASSLLFLVYRGMGGRRGYREYLRDL